MTTNDRDVAPVPALAIPSLRVHDGPPPSGLGLGPVVAAGTEWADVDGRVAVRTALHAAGASVELVGVGSYAVADGSEEVDAWPAAGRPHAVVAAEFDRSVAPLVLSLRGALYLHASGVVTAAGVVAICGRSGAGKSTMAAALAGAGCGFWADDAVVFSGGTGPAPPVSVRLRSALRLDEESTRLVGGPVDGGPPSRPGDLRPVAAVVVLERSADGGAPRIERLSSGAALSAVLEHALCFSLGPGDRGRLVTSYMDLLDAVPLDRLVFTPSASRFASLVDLLLARLQGGRQSAG